MKIPKIVIKGKRKYEFVQKVNDNLFLYKEVNLGFKETFSRADLKIIDNTEIDKIVKAKPDTKIKVLVYDRLMEEERIYDCTKDVAEALHCSVSYINKRIEHKKWIQNRWFCERREVV